MRVQVIDFVDLEARHRPERKAGLQIAAVRQEGRETWRRIVVDARSSRIVEIERGALEVLGVHEEIGVMTAEIDVLESLEGLA